jgi:hypothetical protein
MAARNHPDSVANHSVEQTAGSHSLARGCSPRAFSALGEIIARQDAVSGDRDAEYAYSSVGS